MSPSPAERGRWMRQEITEQPDAVARLCDVEGPAIAALGRRLRRTPPSLVVLAARGTSDNAALYGRYLIETVWGIPVSLAAPSVLTVYRAHLRLRRATVIGLSQSGASPDIVEFLEAARTSGARTIAVTNQEDSRLARAAHDTVLLHGGPGAAWRPRRPTRRSSPRSACSSPRQRPTDRCSAPTARSRASSRTRSRPMIAFARWHAGGAHRRMRGDFARLQLRDGARGRPQAQKKRAMCRPSRSPRSTCSTDRSR